MSTRIYRDFNNSQAAYLAYLYDQVQGPWAQQAQGAWLPVAAAAPPLPPPPQASV